MEAVLAAYTLEGYDSQGNLVYQKELTTQGTKEIYWTYIYDEQERVVEKGMWTTAGSTYAQGVPHQLQKYHYYEDGKSADIVYDYQGDGQEAQEANRTTLSLGAYGREELVCEGDFLIAYRWYEYNDRGNISYLLEITPDGTDSVEYLCTYTVFDYDAKGRLKAAYRYEPVLGEYPDYYIHFRFGDVDTGIIINFDDNGRLNGFASAYYMSEDQPGEVLYYVFPYEDGTFEMVEN